VELRHVYPFCLAGALIPARISLILIAALLLLRGVMAAFLPLSADEAYYWLWSLHPSLGYYDHPPAIAWLIRAGTMLFGDTPLGVRFAGLVLSLPASWFVWKGAALLLKDEDRAALAALLFNLTLMISVELLAATPDMPSVVAAAAYVYFLARVQQSGDGRWWLMVGVAAGLGLLSKYSALFLGLGTLLWLLLDGRQRKWLMTVWPYLGGVVALLIWTPHLLWQAQHDWMTFAFQFGRVSGGEVTLKYLGEFLGAQLGLATPLIFLLMVAGLWRASRRGDDKLVLAVLVWTGIAYFLQHALHDRVQGNWPCFLFPALAILAADAFATTGKARWLSFAAAPLAALLVLLTYAQAQFGVIALKKDPLARILGRDFKPVGDVVEALARTRIAGAIVTTDYETTAWLRFNHPSVKVVQMHEPQRYLWAPAAGPQLLKAGHLYYLVQDRRDRHRSLEPFFASVGFPNELQTPAAVYRLYRLGQPKSSQLGRVP
jgi:4-amino-4-deoxy-L-arabinose transferase-like glycosyltransferase